MNDGLAPFLNAEGQLARLPARGQKKSRALAYLAEKFALGRDYTEREVNATLAAWHTFGDYFLLRRELIDSGLMLRVPDGSRYWRAPEEESPEKQEQERPQREELP